MSAQGVTLRAILIGDVARTADFCGHEAVGRLLLRADVSPADIEVCRRDLARSSNRRARAASDVLDMIGVPARALCRAAVWCGLTGSEWLEESAREQGVTPDADAVRVAAEVVP